MFQHILIGTISLWLMGCLGQPIYAMPIQKKDFEMIKLPKPKATGVGIESTLSSRRSVRDYAKNALRLEDISLLLWAAQGITSQDGKRTAPSAGALYPLEIYLVAGSIIGLDQGVYLYSPVHHTLSITKQRDQRLAISRAALGQSCIVSAPASIIVTAVYHRTAGKYGDRAKRYVHMEAGHAAENLLLQAVALQLGTVVVGAFDDQRLQKVLGLPTDHAPLEIIPLGHPANNKK